MVSTMIKSEHYTEGSVGGLMGSNSKSWDISGLNLANGVYITYIVAKNGTFSATSKAKVAVLK